MLGKALLCVLLGSRQVLSAPESEPSTSKSIHAKVDSNSKRAQNNKNWYLGNRAYNSGLSSLLSKRNHHDVVDVGEPPSLELGLEPEKRNAALWTWLNDDLVNGYGEDVIIGAPQKRSNWYRGNVAYNSGLSGLLSKRRFVNYGNYRFRPYPRGKAKRSNWYAGNNAYSNGLSALLGKRGAPESHDGDGFYNGNQFNWGDMKAYDNFDKRGTNWYAGNSAYTGGLSSLLTKRKSGVPRFSFSNAWKASPSVSDYEQPPDDNTWNVQHRNPAIDYGLEGDFNGNPYTSWGSMNFADNDNGAKKFHTRKRRNANCCGNVVDKKSIKGGHNDVNYQQVHDGLLPW